VNCKSCDNVARHAFFQREKNNKLRGLEKEIEFPGFMHVFNSPMCASVETLGSGWPSSAASMILKTPANVKRRTTSLDSQGQCTIYF